MSLFKSNLTELEDQLWRVVLTKCQEIEDSEHASGTWHGASRGVALLESDRRAVSTILDVGQRDGSHKVFMVTAYSRGPVLAPAAPKVKVARWSHNSEAYWEGQLADRSNAFVVDGQHYRIGSGRGGSLGFGGRLVVIRFNDGREVTTNDLWHQGVIPPVFRDRLPDDASFVKGLS